MGARPAARGLRAAGGELKGRPTSWFCYTFIGMRFRIEPPHPFGMRALPVEEQFKWQISTRFSLCHLPFVI